MNKIIENISNYMYEGEVTNASNINPNILRRSVGAQHSNGLGTL